MSNEKIENTTPKTGTKSYYKNFDDFMAEVNLALTNAADTEIEPLITNRGYPKTAIAAKLAEVADLIKLNDAQKKEYGEQYDATKAYEAQENLLHDDYIDHLELARVAFKNDIAAKTALGLSGRRKESKSGYAAQALLFYNAVLGNATYKQEMNKKGVTDAELQAQKAGYESLAILDAAQTKETGEAQAATKKRDAKLHELEEWYADFKVVATVALRKKPQLREKLGWKE